MKRTIEQGCGAPVWLALMVLLAAGCSPVDVGGRLRLAATEAGTGNWREGAELTRSCLNVQPDNVTAMILHGICLFELRQADEAVDILEVATAAAPEQFLPAYFLGWVLCEQGRFGDAIIPLRRAYEQVAQAPAVKPDVLVLLARCCLEQNLPRGQAYLQALRRYRSFARAPEVYNALGIMRMNQGEYDSARVSLLEALDKDPDNVVVLQNLAVLHDHYLHDAGAAMGYYRKALVACRGGVDGPRQGRLRQRLQQLARERLEPEIGPG